MWLSFLAGLLTVLAPCVFSLLPIILGGSLGEKNTWRPFKVVFSLGLSILLFSILLKGTSLLLPIPNSFWKLLSGSLVTFVGITMLFPELWRFVASRFGFYRSENLLSRRSDGSEKSAYFLGAALGPVFASCSPTYSLILAIVLPEDLLLGSVYLLSYILGIMAIMLLIAYTGQALTKKLRFAVNPKGWFKRSIGLLLVMVGVAVLTGLDKKFETWILDTGYLGPIQIEQSLLDRFF
ncbi:MAG: Cytochrome c biogenesis protein, transmembrane region [Candidatus Peregrinibacteria bacterium GW2011_GWA2_44_7]|nr:MAG: Cytochrome c biogenesis protein, transmembrane region [Candidatus Peregrinibacteria bacterium GW2011_GWA2_44_7]